MKSKERLIIMGSMRTEHDSMGMVKVPRNAYYGAQTQRAKENFPISSLRFPRPFIRALGIIKQAAAKANMDLGLLPTRMGGAIAKAATEVAEGLHDGQFVVDIFQTGSGTSTNMNANEVIANRSAEILGKPRNSKTRNAKGMPHPNDHVNMGQSSNDVIPTAIHVAASEEIKHSLVPALKELQRALSGRARAFDKIIKIGRTHLQDATPVRLGQEFSGYASMIEHGLDRLKRTGVSLFELPLGGTATGTGINTPIAFPKKAIAHISKITKIRFREAANHFEAQGARDACVETSGQLKVIACSLAKIANDLRWMGSGPRCGLGEIHLPALQPGSSIMPGKINPVIPEAVLQVAAQVIGNDAAITVGGMSGNFELNVMKPVIAHNLLESISLLASSCGVFAECIRGIKANRPRCRAQVEQSLAMCTSLAPVIGYDAAAAIAHQAYATGRTVREIAEEKSLMPPEQLKALLDPKAMTGS